MSREHWVIPSKLIFIVSCLARRVSRVGLEDWKSRELQRLKMRGPWRSPNVEQNPHFTENRKPREVRMKQDSHTDGTLRLFCAGSNFICCVGTGSVGSYPKRLSPQCSGMQGFVQSLLLCLPYMVAYSLIGWCHVTHVTESGGMSRMHT